MAGFSISLDERDQPGYLWRSFKRWYHGHGPDRCPECGGAVGPISTIHCDQCVEMAVNKINDAELRKLRHKLEVIGSHPNTPDLIKQYAKGMLDHDYGR